MIKARAFSVVAALLLAGACKTSFPTESVCPERATTWMACPGPGAKEGAVCQVYGPPLGCGFDMIALDYANTLHSRRNKEVRGRFYVFALAVTAQGATRIADDEVPQRLSSVTVDF